MTKPHLLRDKSYLFALRIIKLYKYLVTSKKETVLSKQVLRSGTAIGALLREAEFAQSKADFISKMNIALKETNETTYWLSLLKDSDYLNDKLYTSINNDARELVAMLVAALKKLKVTNGYS